MVVKKMYDMEQFEQIIQRMDLADDELVRYFFRQICRHLSWDQQKKLLKMMDLYHFPNAADGKTVPIVKEQVLVSLSKINYGNFIIYMAANDKKTWAAGGDEEVFDLDDRDQIYPKLMDAFLFVRQSVM